MVRYSVTEHTVPMANSYVPMMTIVCEWGKHFYYQAVPVPQDKTTLCDQKVLEQLFNKYRRHSA